MKKITVTCDWCDQDISETAKTPRFRLVLTAEPMEHTTETVYALHVTPPISETRYFCGLSGTLVRGSAMLTAHERELRRTCLGSSEIALIALGPTFADDSLYELWLSKTAPDLPPRESLEMSVGSFLEDGLGKLFAYRENKIISKGSHRVHRVENWMGASPDFEVWTHVPLPSEGSQLVGPAECKIYRWSNEWGENGQAEAVPAHILCQVNWQMAVMECQESWVVALVGGDYRLYPCPRSDALIERLITLGREFWANNVVTRIPPEPDWTIKRTGELWEYLNPVKTDSISLPVEAEEYAQTYLDANEAIGSLEIDKTTARNHLLSLLGDARYGILSDGRKVTRGTRFSIQKPRRTTDGNNSD